MNLHDKPLRCALIACAASLSSTAIAQTPPEPAPPPSGEPAPPGSDEIIVTAPAERGRTIGSGVPDIRITREEIATYGSGSIGSLLGDLKPVTGEAPIILVNGRRISGMDEIARLPPEAIARIDILPEEVALNYGYRADQRVVNIVLERRFKAVTVEATEKLPTAGSRSETDLSANIVKINSKGRISLDADFSHDTKLTEAERELGDPESPYRTLVPSADTIGVGATLNRKLEVLGGVNATLDTRLDRKSGASLFGLPLDALTPGPLEGHSESTSVHAGLALNGGVANWNWSFTGNADHSRSLSRTDRDNPSGGIAEDRVRSRSSSVSGDLVANGPLVDLPAGKLSATLKAGAARRAQDSDSSLFGVTQSRDTANTQTQLSANINLPIASRKNKVLAALGDLSANINLAHEGVSEIGSAETIGYGLSWSPAVPVRLTATVTRANGLPPQAQREDPVLTTPNVPIYDFVTGETVDVTRIDCGNPDLKADRRKMFSLSGRYKPFKTSSLTLNLTYTQVRSHNQIGTLPAATAAIEAAFPERFVRDGIGQLVLVDARPVNFARARQRQLSWGLFWSRDLGQGSHPSKSGAGSAPVKGADEEAFAEGSAQGSTHGMRGDMPSRGARLLLSFNHIWRIENDLLIRPGLPTLDLLDGEAFGARGQSRHQLNARANLTRKGLGAALETFWQSGSELKGTTTNLSFSPLTTFNLRLFADLGLQEGLVAKHPFFAKSRLSLDIGNLFDARVRVTDANGNTPEIFRPAFLDPIGRSVKLSFRKLF